jgi:hypothetical protein
MKFNFKRIASVLTGAVMLSSTVALAAAADMYPAPFVTGSTADVAVVYGAAAANSDVLAAQNVATELGSKQLASATSTSSATPVDTDSEDVVVIDRENSKLHLGSAVTSVFSRSINEDDFPALLAEGVYQDNDNTDREFTQKIDMYPLTLSQFSDSDYDDRTSSLGFRVASGTGVLNYTLEFSDQPNFDDTAMVSTDLELMGKTYSVLDTENNTALSLTLLDSANTYMLNEGESKDITVDGKTYKVALSMVSSTTQAKITVEGTSKTLSVGGTLKVADNVYLGLKDVGYSSRESTTPNAEITMGSGKLVLTDSQEVQMNEKSVSGMYSYINQTTAGKLKTIKLQWRTDGDQFVTEDSSITMPGFETIKVSTGGLIFPEEEKIVVENDGKDTITLTAPVKDGEVSIDILSVAGTGNRYFTVIGKESTKQLATSNSTSLTFNEDTDEYFVVSYANGKDSESYVLKASSFTSDTTTTPATNKTTIKNVVSEKEWTEKKASDYITMGNVELQLGQIDKEAKTVVITATSSYTSFNKLYTAEGLEITLPTDATAMASTTPGAINLTSNLSTSYNLIFKEEDKDENVAAGGQFNLTLGRTGTDNLVTISAVGGDVGVAAGYEIGSSNVYQYALYSQLATVINHDTDPTQQTAEVMYHGKESYAQLVLSAPSATVGGPGEVGNIMKVSDSEVATVQGKNLIVVGGSCVNTVAQALLGSTSKMCGEAFTAKTGIGAGEFLINTYDNPYTTGKVATLVAGYDAADTEAAVNALGTKDVPTDVGSTYTGSTVVTVSDSE